MNEVTRTIHVEGRQPGEFPEGVAPYCDVVLQETYDGEVYMAALGAPENPVATAGKRPLDDNDFIGLVRSMGLTECRVVNRCDGKAETSTIAAWCAAAERERLGEPECSTE